METTTVAVAASDYRVPVTVMGKDWRPRTVMRHTRMAPYARRPARFENVCGQYLAKVHYPAVASAVVDSRSFFGVQKEMYHTEGAVTLNGRTATYKGCRGHQSIGRLARALCLHGAESRVHMAILSGTTGTPTEVRQEGYLEIRLWPCVQEGLVRVEPPFEQTNSLRLSITRFEGEFALPEAIRPVTNDWTVTLRGAVIARMTWAGLEWRQETEDALAAFADRVIAMLAERSREPRAVTPLPSAPELPPA